MTATCFDIATSKNEHVSSSMLLEQNVMSDCLHCDIHRLLKDSMESDDMSLSDVTAKVVDVLADLIMVVPDPLRTRHMVYTLGCLVQSILAHNETVEDTAEAEPRGVIH